MPQLDAISPNPKQPKRKPRVNPRGVVPELPPQTVERRRKLMWAIIGGCILIIIIFWFSSLGTRLRGSGDNSAWNTLMSKLGNAFTSAQQAGNAALKNINTNAPSQQEVQTIQQQVFPNADAVTGQANANANVNVPVANTNATNVNSSTSNANGNVNRTVNQNTNAN